MNDALKLIETTLDEVLPKADTRPIVLSEAMRYAVLGAGKRIRPLICLASSIAVGGTKEDAKYPAAAIEILHNYTLVHDDLPAMDNDEMRRGRLAVWKKFGEANAILAGDALLALAYKVASLSPRNAREIVQELGEKGVGVVQGQVEDIEKNKDITYIYTHKTADLFIASAKMGALAGGGTAQEVAIIGEAALNLGLAFQYEDDLLDGDSPCSREETLQRIKEATDKAISGFKLLSGDSRYLIELAERLVNRKI